MIWDSRASACITKDKSNFMTPIKKIQNHKVNGISGAMGITRLGRGRWSLNNTAGELQHLELKCCCAPSATQRLLSTSVFCKECPKNAILLTPKSWTAQPNPNKPEENAINIVINPIDNSPEQFPNFMTRVRLKSDTRNFDTGFVRGMWFNFQAILLKDHRSLVIESYTTLWPLLFAAA